MDLKNNHSRYFPTSYDHRPQQQKITNDVIKGMKKGQLILIESPPGTGKTLATLGGVLPFARFPDGRIYWLGAYQSIYQNLTKDILAINREKSSALMLSLFIRKQSMCFGDYEGSPSGFYDYCSDLRKKEKCSYYNNTFLTHEEINPHGELVKRVVLREEARQLLDSLKKMFRTGQYQSKNQTWAKIVIHTCKERYCPYEMMKLLIDSSDIFAGDYNYVFQRGIKQIMDKIRLFTPERKVLIIDEADKFHERLLDQLTIKLSSNTIRIVIKRLEDEIKELESGDDLLPIFRGHLEFIEDFDRIMKVFISKHLQLEPQKQIEVPKQSFIRFLDDQGGFTFYYERIDEIIRDAFSEEKWSSRMDDFLILWNELDESNFVRIAVNKSHVEKSKRKKIWYSIEIHPLNIHNIPLYFRGSTPVYLPDVLKEFTDVVFLSATLYPDIFIKRMGLSDWPQIISKVTNYHIPPENYLFVVTPFLTSEYNQRREMTVNYAESLYQLLKQHPRKEILLFSTSEEMTISIREHLKNIKPKINPELVNWNYVRSSDSRGIDLSGYTICLIAGLPFPPIKKILPKARLENLKKEFGKQEGWRIFQSDIIKETIQSFCRILRKPDDKALIILGDSRFAQRGYHRHFPWYYHKRMKTCDSLEDLLHLSKNFFTKNRIRINPFAPIKTVDTFEESNKLPPEVVEYQRRLMRDIEEHQKSGGKLPFRPTYTPETIKKELNSQKEGNN